MLFVFTNSFAFCQVAAVDSSKVEIVQDTKRLRPTNSEVERLLADSSFMRQTTGWKNQVSLEDGLAQTIDWISQHMGLYRPKEYAI